MAKLSLADISNILGNPTSAQNTLNNNNTLIEAALENTLSRNGLTPNQMEADLDLNNNDILNVRLLDVESLFIDGAGLTAKDLAAIRAVSDAIADGTLSNVVAQGNVPIYSNIVGMSSTRVQSALNSIRVDGYYTPGDNGGGLYKRTSVEPTHPGKFQDANGGWWELSANVYVTPLQFGAIADGSSNDSQAIANMFEFARRFGLINFFPGNGRIYTKDGRTLVFDNTTIEISASATLRRTGSDPYIFVNGDGTRGGGYTGCTNFVLRGGTIDLNSSGPATTAVLVFAHHDRLLWENSRVVGGYGSHTFECNSSRNVLVRNVRFNQKGYASSGNFETIQLDYSNSAGFPAFGPYDNTPCQNVIVRDCYFESAHSGVGSHSTPPLTPHSNIFVMNNYFENQGGYGIRPQGWNNSTVYGNIINNAALRGVLCWSCSDVRIVGNSIQGGCSDFGIQVSWDGSVLPYAVKVRDNFVNAVSGVGIYLSNGTYHSVTENMVVDSGQEAIMVSANTVLGVDIRDNKVIGASASGNGSYSAIRCAGISCSVTSNTVRRSSAANTYSYAIYLPTGSSANNVDMNDVQFGTTADIGDQSATTSLNAINGRVLLFTGNAGSGTVTLAADITQFPALEVQTGSVSTGFFSSGRAIPFATNRRFNPGSDRVTVKTIQGKVDCAITNATTLTIATANDNIRNIYGLTR